jgi:hypothetical protein
MTAGAATLAAGWKVNCYASETSKLSIVSLVKKFEGV